MATWPEETSIASAPWATKARAISTASCSVLPSGTQSVAEMRTIIGRSAGQAARTASNTSSGKRSRFSSEPPYSSVRWLATGERNEESRYPWAQCSSSRSKPASAPRRAAATKSATIAVQVGAGQPRAASGSPGPYGSGDGPMTGQLPSGSGSSMPSHISRVEPLRPEWPSCRPIRAVDCCVHELDDPRPGVALLVGPQAGAARA